MGTSILRGCVKKINIINRTGRERWHQEIQILVSDIEMNNENLIEVRRFRPDEIVEIELRSAQLSLFDQPKKRQMGKKAKSSVWKTVEIAPLLNKNFASDNAFWL
ncbi:hypothetical protein JCM19046_3462 [Bacillus sp. JCM 19046]|nr:hypothetical protein JCM19046_3462 [Bacillus sp. JCM 19046]